MKALNLLPLFLAGSMFAGCSEAMEDAPLDAEFGLETLDGKDDSFSIRPGSPEAEAVVKFVNQPIADDAAGVAFRDLIDTRIHAKAAKNIAKFRAGSDGTFGTGDDMTFADLTALDRIPFVGRSTMMQLFELAEADGYFTRASLDCADYLARDNYNRYYLRSYADLLEVGNSRCTTINGDLYIQITGTDILPPSAREIESLQHLVTVTGNVIITGNTIWNSLNFKSLETIGKDLTATYNSSAKHTLKFPALKNVGKINLTRMQSTSFDALESAPEIRLNDTDMTGFTALQTTPLLELNRTLTGEAVVEFPTLKTVGNLTLNYSRPSYTTYDVVYRGSFAKLTTVDNFTMNYGKYATLTFPALVDVTGALSSMNATDPYAGMTKLKNVGGLYSTNDIFSAGANAGPAVLASAGTIKIAGNTDVNGYEKLKHVDVNIAIDARNGIQGFNALETIGGSIALYPGRSNTGMFAGFNRLTNVAALMIDAGNTVTVGETFKSLENIEGTLNITNGRSLADNITFKSLVSVGGGGINVQYLLGATDAFPVLDIVDGPIVFDTTASALKGMNKLTHIEGTLQIRNGMYTLEGLKKLTSIGGNIRIPRTFTGAALDDFLNQLTEFSGTITYAN